MIKLVSVEALPQYRLRVSYSDGSQGDVDLADLVGRGVFSALTDFERFRRVSVGSDGEITWEGNLDICSDAAYLKLTGKKPEDLFPVLRGGR